MATRDRSPATEAAPHSWDVDGWPAMVWPNDARRARYIIRTCKNELIAEGALSRVGRRFVVLGAPYTRWLQKNGARAAKFDIAPNRAA